MTRSWRLGRLLVVLAALAVAAYLLLPAGLAALGRWLIVDEPLAPADAIFVHAGGVPFRAKEGAALYAQGLAPEVWIMPTLPTPNDEELVRIGVPHAMGWEVDRQVLTTLGVPSEAVRVLPERAATTRDEIRAVTAEMRRRGLHRVILVTTKEHSRRVRAIWRRYADEGQTAQTRAASDDPFEPEGWWRDMDQAQAVVHELVALVDLWLGSPISGEE